MAYDKARIMAAMVENNTGNDSAGELDLFQLGAVLKLMDRMEKMAPIQRVTAFQILHDHYCRGCGIEQPNGDCPCVRSM